MIQINLLSWRETSRLKERKYIYVLGAILLGSVVGMIVLWRLIVGYSYLMQENRNDFLNKELTQATARYELLKTSAKKEAKLMEQLTPLIAAQNNRMSFIEFLNILPANLPDGVYLGNIGYQNQIATLIGEASENTQVTMLMNNLLKIPLIVAPSLNEIAQPPTSLGKKFFKLQFKFKEA